MRLKTNYPARKLGVEQDYEAVKRNGWKDHGLFVVSINDDRLSWVDREYINVLAEKMYGPRRS